MLFPKRPHDFEVGIYFIHNFRVGYFLPMAGLTSRGMEEGLVVETPFFTPKNGLKHGQKIVSMQVKDH